MQLNIKNGEAYRLARSLADRTGESLTEAVTKALRERLEREQAQVDPTTTKAERLKRIKKVLARFDSLPTYDDRDADEIIGYDEDGLPA